MKTTTGVELSETSMTSGMDAHAKRLGVDVKAYLAQLPDGSRQYVLVDGGDVIYESTLAEAVGVRIEAMAAADRFERKSK